MRCPKVLLITDPSYDENVILGVIEEVSGVLRGGTFAVQLRDKVRDQSAAIAFAHRVRKLTTELGVPLIINGEPTMAREARADGLHAASSIETGSWGLWRSVPVHDDREVAMAAAGAVDAVLVSPVFDTPGKGAARGLEAITRARAGLADHIRVIALGGIDASSASSCFEAGADGVAVIRALLGATDPAAVARALAEVLAKAPGAPRMY